MSVIIVDNFLDPILIDLLNIKFLYETPHTWGHSSNSFSQNHEKEDMFYAANLDSNDFTLKYIHLKLSNHLRLQTEIKRVYINIQHNNMKGNFHYDDGDITTLLMITPTPQKGGQFEYIDQNNKIKTIPYEQNKLIVFNGIKHRGCCYVDDKPRITLAYKLNIVKTKL
tara:strand:- start:170 stop:673 length:504 start_codon:yes stop_codon:yes gene_type:complete